MTRQTAVGQLGDCKVSAKWRNVGWFALGVMILLVWWAYSTELASTLASGAQAPWPMVDRWLDPELRTLDPSCHADELRQSLYMRGFLVTEWLGIDRTTALSLSMLLGFVMVALGSVALVQAFAPGAGPAAWLLFATWNLATAVPKVDLANFGGGLSASGQMYAPAFGCGLLAIAFVLRRSWIAFGCFVAIAAMCHIVVAFYFAAVAVAMALPSLRRADWPRFSVGLLIAAGVSGVWAAGVVGDMPEQMSKSDWMQHARFGNSHWFPFDHGTFGKLHYWGGSTIFLCVALCGLVAIRFVKDRCRRLQWYSGVLAAVSLTVIGLAASLFAEEPAIIKLGLHRSSAVVTQLALLVVVLFLVDRLRGRGPSAWCAILVLLFATAQGMGPFVGLLLLLVMLLQAPPSWRWIPGAAIGVLIVWLVSIWLRGHLGTWEELVFGSSRRYGWSGFRLMFGSDVVDVSRATKLWIIIGAWGLLGLVHQVVDRKSQFVPPTTAATMGVVLVLALASASTAGWLRIQDRSTKGRDRHGDFLAAQLWASENTSPHDLFFVDPTDDYGFREYSGRPTFGTPREWVHTSFLYGGSLAAFEEGLRKSRIFGVDPADFMEGGSSYPGYIRYRTTIRNAIHSKEPRWFSALAEEEGLDYIVVRVENSESWAENSPVYENSSYRIYDLRSEAATPPLEPPN